MKSRKVQLQGFLLTLPMQLLFGTFFHLFLWESAMLDMDYREFFVTLVILLVISVFFHEFLHGLGWKLAGKRSMRKMRLRLKGILPAYSYGQGLMKTSAYLTGVMFPLLILGGGGLVWLFIHPGILPLISILLNMFLAGTDIIIGLQVIKSGAVLVEDAVGETGFYGWYKV